MKEETRRIPLWLYNRLEYLGIIDHSGVRNHNFGASKYLKHLLTIWAIWLDYPELDEFRKMIVKYALRDKTDTDSEDLELDKIIHYAQEKKRQNAVLRAQNATLEDIHKLAELKRTSSGWTQSRSDDETLQPRNDDEYPQ